MTSDCVSRFSTLVVKSGSPPGPLISKPLIFPGLRNRTVYCRKHEQSWWEKGWVGYKEDSRTLMMSNGTDEEVELL